MTNLDAKTELGLEAVARTLDRRRFLKRSLHTGFALLSGLVLWSLPAAREVLASACLCQPPGGFCPNCPGGQGYGCPPLYQICVSGSGCSLCKYPTGHWTSGGCGTCGNGSVQCTDCNSDDRPGHCGLCGCQSSCFCCSCCSPQEISMELAKNAQAA